LRPSFIGGRAEACRRDYYLTWTADALLRHTVYVGLRDDKPATEVHREARGEHNSHHAASVAIEVG
jgi:hypothetical protein